MSKKEVKKNILFLQFNTLKNPSNKTIFTYCDNDSFKISQKHDFRENRDYYCRRNSIFTNNSIINEKHNIDVLPEDDILFRVMKSKNDNIFKIINPVYIGMELNAYNIFTLEYRMWLTLKSENKDIKYENENSDYNLLENDIIKIGNRIYEVIKKNIINKGNEKGIVNKINLKNNNNSVFDISLKDNEFLIKDSKDEYLNNEFNKCRICENNESDESNPLLKICDCEKYIHYNCLKENLKKKIIITKEGYPLKEEKKTVFKYSYNTQNFSCENCHFPYPFKFQIKNKIYYLIDDLVPKSDINYIILENLIDPKNNKNKNIYVVTLGNKDIVIGKEKDSDIIDIDNGGMSRLHAILKFNQNTGDVTIVNKSRYGTLVLIKDNITLKEKEKIYFQIGITYIKAENLIETYNI